MCGCGCGAYLGQCLRHRYEHDLEETIDRLHTQLAGVSVAALGGTNVDQRAMRGMYGWCPTYDDVLSLRLKYDELLTIVEALYPLALDVRSVEDE
jgi:hypothetical protein